MRPTKPVLLGEDNPYSADPDMALFPHPERSAGYRLAVRILGMSRDAYLCKFDRVNLCRGSWFLSEARETWSNIVGSHPRPRYAVALGAKVCGALRIRFEPFEVLEPWSPDDCHGLPFPVAILPHPSGRSRAWNEPGSFERARATLERVGEMTE